MEKFKMPIKVKPYKHQMEAHAFALKMFGVCKGGKESGDLQKIPKTYCKS